MWPFANLFAYFTPWLRQAPSQPLQSHHYNLRRRRDARASLAQRILRPLGLAASRKRKRRSQDEAVGGGSSTYLAMPQEKRRRLGDSSSLPAADADMEVDADSERSFAGSDATTLGGYRDEEERDDEFDSVSWNDETDIVAPSDDDDTVAELLADEEYAAYRKREPTPEPYRELHPQTLAKADVRTKERYGRLMRAKEDSLGWPLHDRLLLIRFQLRGFEPLLPHQWKPDFAALPEHIFTDEAEAQIVALGIDQEKAKDVRACRALEALIDVGPRVRDYITFGMKRPGAAARKGPETLIRMAVEKYIRWSLRDAGFEGRERFLPTIIVQEGRGNVDTAVLEENLVRELQTLRAAWETALDHEAPAPPLYGIIATSHSLGIVALVTEDGDAEAGNLDIRHSRYEPGNQLRSLLLLTWKAEGQDFWNALAIAQLAMHARRHIQDAIFGHDLDMEEI